LPFLLWPLPFLLVIPEGDLLFIFPSPETPVTLPAMPLREYHFWVYILASRSRKPLRRHDKQHSSPHRQTPRTVSGTHTAHYNIHRLVYFEYFRYVRSAISREKELKRWTRAQKIELIEKTNPTWEDLLPPNPVQP
jgi:putative endonuclease